MPFWRQWAMVLRAAMTRSAGSVERYRRVGVEGLIVEVLGHVDLWC